LPRPTELIVASRRRIGTIVNRGRLAAWPAKSVVRENVRVRRKGRTLERRENHLPEFANAFTGCAIVKPLRVVIGRLEPFTHSAKLIVAELNYLILGIGLGLKLAGRVVTVIPNSKVRIAHGSLAAAHIVDNAREIVCRIGGLNQITG